MSATTPDSPTLITGIPELDSLIGRSFTRGSMVVVAGHPGSGKTTLALTICRSNAVRQIPCLYITFQEDKDKLVRYAKFLGLNLDELEAMGLLDFVKLPVSASIGDLIEEVGNVVRRKNYGIIVIDSINAILAGLERSGVERLYLQNYFYTLPTLTNSILILISELPLESDILPIAGIEFVADIVVILKHKIRRGLIERYMEIRKARGNPLNIAELPFIIEEFKGLKLWPPIIVSEIMENREEIRIPCKSLADALGSPSIWKSEVIYITYPSNSRPIYAAMIPLALSLASNLKMLVVSYKYPKESIYYLISKALDMMGLTEDEVKRLISIIEITSLNPFSTSLSSIAHYEISLAEGKDIVVFHGVDIPMVTFKLRRYIPALYNQINYLKNMGVQIVRMSSYINHVMDRVNASLSDIVFRFKPVMIESGRLGYKIYTWRRGYHPYIMDLNIFELCMREAGSIIKSRCIHNG
ncbi:MAG: ATPase domain-containing protein [Acidilobaceae archaeon]